MSQPRGKLTFSSVRWSGRLTLWTVKCKVSKRTLSDYRVGFYRPTWRGKKRERLLLPVLSARPQLSCPLREKLGSDTQGSLQTHVAVLWLPTQGEGLFVQVLDSPRVVRLCHALQCHLRLLQLEITDLPVTPYVLCFRGSSELASLSVECSLTWKSPSQEMLLSGRRKAQPDMCKTASSVTASRWWGPPPGRAVTSMCG